MDKKIIYLTGGTFNRRKIISYSNNTRPTSQKVRLAVFNSLFLIEGIGLDLFSGSGAYAFEALSRGLEFCYINDNDNLAIKSITENVNTLKVTDQVKITKQPFLKALNYYETTKVNFDLVFIDPPYDFSEDSLLEIFTWLNNTQKKGLRVVLERTSSKGPLNIDGFKLVFDKKYGSQKIFIYQKL